jgi:hypothetical protein
LQRSTETMREFPVLRHHREATFIAHQDIRLRGRPHRP